MARTELRPRDVARMGTSAAPTTEKEPLIPQAQTNNRSLPNLARAVIARGIGNPIRKAGGATSRTQQKDRHEGGKTPIQLSTQSDQNAPARRREPMQKRRTGKPKGTRTGVCCDSKLPSPEKTSMPVITTADETV